jgi:hypothetical protein
MSKAAKNEQQPGKSYLVVQEFRDKDNFDLIYKIGDDVSALSEDRLERLVKLGYVKQK